MCFSKFTSQVKSDLFLSFFLYYALLINSDKIDGDVVLLCYTCPYSCTDFVQVSGLIIHLLFVMSIALHQCCPASFMVLPIKVHIQFWFWILRSFKEQGILLFFLFSFSFGISSLLWGAYSTSVLYNFWFLWILKVFSGNIQDAGPVVPTFLWIYDVYSD